MPLPEMANVDRSAEVGATAVPTANSASGRPLTPSSGVTTNAARAVP